MNTEKKGVSLQLDQPELTADLAAWLDRHAVDYSMDGTPNAMGAGDATLLVGAGSLALRAALGVLRDWVAARRTLVTVQLPNGRHYQIDAASRPSDIVAMIEAVSRSDPDT